MNGLDKVGFEAISEETLAALPTSDAILCVGTLQVLSHAEIRSFLAFARDNLRPGGRLLCNTASPRMLVDWLARLRRVRYDGWRAQLGWAGALARGLAQRRIADDDRRSYCLRPGTLIRAVEEHGFSLVRGPGGPAVAGGAARVRALDRLRVAEAPAVLRLVRVPALGR